MPPNVARAEATVPPPCQILGTPLRPFCLGHRLLFRRLGLPFAVNHDADFGPDDLLLGVAICAASYEDTLESLLNGEWPVVFRRWKGRLRGPWWKRQRVNLQRAEHIFRDYLKDGNALPPLWRRGRSCGLEMSAPLESLLKLRLVMAGFSESEVLNGYLPGRWYDYFTAVEIRNAEKCEDIKTWRPVFYTAKHDAELHGENHNGDE